MRRGALLGIAGLLALTAPFPETNWVLVEDSRRYARHLSVTSTPLLQYLPFLVVASIIFLMFILILAALGLCCCVWVFL